MSARPPVVVVSGHMVDALDRPTPRFAPDQVPRVRREVRAALINWNVGAGTTIVGGGARGADIIVAEEGKALGARVHLCLALPPDEFVQRSVEGAGGDWVERFEALRRDATVEIADTDATARSIFAAVNERLVAIARELAGDAELPHAVLVWDGRRGDGPGGTRDFVLKLGYKGPDPAVRVIDPTSRAYEERQSSPGQKRMLTLDGGGMRGALTLQILQSLEDQLSTAYGSEQTLSEYFDYIGGTSTGAIIAAALAWGKPVAEVAERYAVLGERVFKKRLLPMRFRSMYKDGPLTEELNEFFGEDATLGDPRFQSLLLMVMHNVVTDSPWPVSNCTNAKYNSAGRCLLARPDRNLDISLTQLLRGSTAAPLYFEPEKLRVGEHEFSFQDGGVTPFNNPALLLFVMATLEQYGLRWPADEQQLLVVSVGTGASAAVHPAVAGWRSRLPTHLSKLPGVFMNGSSVAQDLLCRTLGRCRAGQTIDREFGARIDETGMAGRNLFTYLRYNADLSDEALIQHGITRAKDRKAVRKLDSVSKLDDLRSLGDKVAETIDIQRDFAGFLP